MADVPHRLPVNAQTQLQAACTRPLCSKAEKVYQHLFRALFLQTFPRNNANIAAGVPRVIENEAETAMGTGSGTGSTVNASGTQNAIVTNAIVNGTEIGNE